MAWIVVRGPGGVCAAEGRGGWAERRGEREDYGSEMRCEGINKLKSKGGSGPELNPPLLLWLCCPGQPGTAATSSSRGRRG